MREINMATNNNNAFVGRIYGLSTVKLSNLNIPTCEIEKLSLNAYLLTVCLI